MVALVKVLLGGCTVDALWVYCGCTVDALGGATVDVLWMLCGCSGWMHCGCIVDALWVQGLATTVFFLQSVVDV